mgnify:CR=1 FL=1
MGIHAAAVVRWPGRIKPGSESAALISYVDVVPTFLELAGGSTGASSFDGRSFLPVLLGKKQVHHSFVYAVNTTRGIYHGSEAYGIRALTDGDWLYIRNLHPGARFQNMVTYRDPIYASWKKVDSDFARSRVARYAKRPAVELFDLRVDPWCLRNLAGDSRLAPRSTEFSRRLSKGMEPQGEHGAEPCSRGRTGQGLGDPAEDQRGSGAGALDGTTAVPDAVWKCPRCHISN